MKTTMLSFLLFSFALLGSCSFTPKGDYSSSMIERPYALPDDIAVASFGLKAGKFGLNGLSQSPKKKTRVAPTIGLENGISENVSWIYPLGLRWGIHQGKIHTFGLRASTVFFVSQYSFDYWYRLNSSLSIRPYRRGLHASFILVKFSSSFQGVEFLYQITSDFALSLYGHFGRYQGSSPLIEGIVRGLFEDDSFSTKVEGSLKELGLNGLYSINENWDFYTTIGATNYKFKDFERMNIAAHLGLNYIW